MKLDRLSPLPTTFCSFIALLSLQTGWGWLLSQLHSSATAWRFSADLAHSTFICLLTSGLFYALLAQHAHHRRDINLLNHEIRNALQVIVYATVITDQKSLIRAQVDRITGVLRQVSNMKAAPDRYPVYVNQIRRNPEPPEVARSAATPGKD